MTAKEMKIKTFSLIEEYYPEHKELADDQDVKYKINGVINSIMLDLMKYRKIPAKYSFEITEVKNALKLNSIPDFYQLDTIENIEYKIMGNLEIIFNIEDISNGLPKNVEIYYYKYPKTMQLTFESEDASALYDEEFEFEQELDILEIMPYGIAADLLKMDMISNYGRYFDEKYRELKQTIDSRKTKGTAIIVGGVDI